MKVKKNTEPGIDLSEPERLHRPVMLEEVLALLQVAENKNYIDGTLGLGGHAQAILGLSAPRGQLLGIDRDRQALALAAQRLAPLGDRVRLQHGTYDRTAEYLQAWDVASIDGMLLDLGVSSLQLDDPERGFSFSKDSALDMRMDLEEEVTARELLATLSEEELARLLYEYGEERFARRIARQLVRRRAEFPVERTGELQKIVSRAVPFSRSKIHPATRTFQALRIAVNRELQLLRTFLQKPPDFLKPGGRLVILTFHSLEDRMVKHAFRSFAGYKILTKKPLCAGPREKAQNPRARSAKLRALERII